METIETTTEVTLFGETHEIEVRTWGDSGNRYESTGLVVVGRFPTGTKLHRTNLTLWKKNQSTGRELRGTTVATINGEEYIADPVLYIHNSNRGRIVAWNEEAFAAHIAKWR